MIIEELSAYQEASIGDGKRMATAKEDVKEQIGRSPDHSDTWLMRMYFVVREKVLPDTGEQMTEVINKQLERFQRTRNNSHQNSAK